MLLIVPIIGLLTSCGTQETISAPKEVKTLHVDIYQAEKFKDISSLFDTSYFKVVALETTDEALVGGRVKNAFYRNGRIYIAEYQSASVFMFDDNGKFLKKIHTVGEGPLDYRAIGNVRMTDDRLYIEEEYGFKILCYDLDLNYVGQASLKKVRNEEIFYPTATFAVDDRIYLANMFLTDDKNFIPYKICSMDLNGGNPKYFLPYELDAPTTPSHNFYLRNQSYCDIDGQVRFMCASFDTVFVATRDTVTPLYVFDFGKNQLPYSMCHEEDAKKIIKDAKYKDYVRFYSMEESSRYMIFYLSMGGGFDPRSLSKIPNEISKDAKKRDLWMNENTPFNACAVFLDKETDEVFVTNGFKIEKFAYYRLGELFFCDRDYMIKVSDNSPSMFDENKKAKITTDEDHPYPEYEKAVNDVLVSLAPESNPVVYIYKFK